MLSLLHCTFLRRQKFITMFWDVCITCSGTFQCHLCKTPCHYHSWTDYQITRTSTKIRSYRKRATWQKIIAYLPWPPTPKKCWKTLDHGLKRFRRLLFECYRSPLHIKEPRAWILPMCISTQKWYLEDHKKHTTSEHQRILEATFNITRYLSLLALFKQ